MSSSLIDVLVRHCKGADPPRLPTAEQQLPTLAGVLSSVPYPRRARGRRYQLGSLLAVCLVAVLGGARSLAQIARFAADCDPDLYQPLGPVKATPNASTLGRLLARLDGDAVDDWSGAGWPATAPTLPTSSMTR
ncbi:transposase family protein [Streptomyces sp. NPDC001795]|uniref:transposase family protein n=1 Tax=Streptomyces sp. NPDC001795 TaxID=3154525 RepID=UPI003325587C